MVSALRTYPNSPHTEDVLKKNCTGSLDLQRKTTKATPTPEHQVQIVGQSTFPYIKHMHGWMDGCIYIYVYMYTYIFRHTCTYKHKCKYIYINTIHIWFPKEIVSESTEYSLQLSNCRPKWGIFPDVVDVLYRVNYGKLEYFINLK